MVRTSLYSFLSLIFSKSAVLVSSTNEFTKSILNLSYNELIKLNILSECNRVIDTSSSNIIQAQLSLSNKKKWTIDNFGPVVVPKDYYFLLSDNRSNAIDSRYRGCIHKDDIIAKVIE